MENTKKRVNVVIAEVGMEVEESTGGINDEGAGGGRENRRDKW